MEVRKDGDAGVDGLGGVDAVTVSPDGKHLYTAGPGENSVAVFSRASTTGELAFVEFEKDDVGGVDGLNGATSVTVSPDGNHVYATSQFDDSVVVFDRHSSTGEVTFVELHRDGIGGVNDLSEARSVIVSPDGNHVYDAGRRDSAVALFVRDSSTGKFTFAEVKSHFSEGIDELYGATSVTVSPDGKHVYVASFENMAAVFSRNQSTSKLTFVESEKEGVGGVSGLSSDVSVKVSPDWNHVYITSWEGAMPVFSRNCSTGEITFAEVLKNGVGGVDGLDWTGSVTVSPDGKYVYAAGYRDDAVTVFSRNATTGVLTFVELEKDGVGGVDGLCGVISVTVSPNRKYVYSAYVTDDAVAAFGRNATTGELTFVEDEKDDTGGVDGLDGAASIALSPDGKHLYVAAENDDA
ncbi:MAG: lactonase family protein [SAR202 cluster bacterium]|nr:lactonase family protein [SAR202 cluster bacterium]